MGVPVSPYGGPDVPWRSQCHPMVVLVVSPYGVTLWGVPVVSPMGVLMSPGGPNVTLWGSWWCHPMVSPYGGPDVPWRSQCHPMGVLVVSPYGVTLWGSQWCHLWGPSGVTLWGSQWCHPMVSPYGGPSGVTYGVPVVPPYGGPDVPWGSQCHIWGS